VSAERRDVAAMAAGRRRAAAIAGLRGLARSGTVVEADGEAPVAAPEAERCELCGRGIPEEHSHLLDLHERWILCACETCMGLRSGDRRYRPAGTRTLWLEDFEMPEDLWADLRIPIRLAFFLHSSVTECPVAMYPSPGGATESELHFENWGRLRALNPVLEDLEPDAEALLVNRIAEPPLYAIAPIDRCYELVGLVKSRWEGISGGVEVDRAVDEFFARLRETATVP
jgi:hypothetical protein